MSIGILLVIVYLWAIGKALIIGVTGVTPVMVVSYGLQFNVLLDAGKQPAIVLTDIDPKTGMTGSLPFALLLVVDNLVNSFMEEGCSEV
ncbi:MAG: hypothetical protein OEW82_03400 [Dehalococcoidia bacterium]|nr:hypothetical protein [Dehalococcoidia bacterium]